MAKRLSQLYQEELQRVTGSSSNYRSDLRVARYGDGRKSTETNALNAIASNQQNKDLDTYAEYEAASGLTEKYALSEGKRHLYEKGLYALIDRFTTTLSAGSVNGTNAEPIGGARLVTDTGNHLSIISSSLSADGGTGTWGDPGIVWPSFTAAVGRIFILSVKRNDSSANVGPAMGIYSSNVTTGSNTAAFKFNSATDIRSGNISIAVSVNNTQYSVAFVTRSTGLYVFIKGGIYTYWNLIWFNASGTLIFPAIADFTAIFTANNARVPNALWIPTPLAYDTFNRTNGVLGSTLGLGQDNQTTPIRTWTSTAGTWAVSSNAAIASALSGGLAFATVDVSNADVSIEANLTRSAGVVGIVLRYANSNNYIIAYHDGTNAKLDKVIGGSTTNVISVVKAYSSGALMRILCSGSTFFLFYNGAAVGSAGTISDAAVQTTTVHGMYTTDTGATFDNFYLLPRGTSNEYSALDFF